MTTDTNSAKQPTNASEERKTLRVWLEENDPPAGLVDDLFTMRALVAMGCTMLGLDPGLAARHLMTRSELVEMMTSAKAKHAEILAPKQLAEHQAPIIPAGNLLCAMVIERPSNGQVNSITDAALEAAGNMSGEERKGLRSSMLSKVLNQCALFPPVVQRQRWFIDYGGLQLEFSNKCIALGNKAAEEVVGK